MNEILKVEEDPKLVRQASSNAILNIDNSGLSAYKKRKRDRERIDALEQKVDSIAVDMGDIKHLLERILHDSNR